MSRLMYSLIDQFNSYHPDVRFDYQMYGTASAVGALYTGAGDIAILGEEISPAALRAFTRAKGYPPTNIAVATGSLDVNFYDYAHMIFVHKDNPIERLSLRQLEAVFGAGHRRGERSIRRWGELGLSGSWSQPAIQPYGWRTEVDFALFFRERVLEGSHRWNTAIKEFVHERHDDGTQVDHGELILKALANDPHGIAISNVRYQNADVKVVALAWDDDGPWLLPDDQTLIDQSYPLVRIIPAIIDQPPGQSITPAVREFLRFMLSREGQQALLDGSGYLPLSAEQVATQMEKLR